MKKESLTAEGVSSAPGFGSSAPAPIAFDSLRRFLGEVPDLRRLLTSPSTCEQELQLREEMRRTVAALAALLDDEARVEPAPVRAAVLRGTSRIASELAECALPRNAAGH